MQSKTFCENSSVYVWGKTQFSMYLDQDLKKMAKPIIERNAFHVSKMYFVA